MQENEPKEEKIGSKSKKAGGQEDWGREGGTEGPDGRTRMNRGREDGSKRRRE